MALIGWIFRTLFLVAVLLVALSIAWVFAYRYIAPPTTYPMLRDGIRGVHVEYDFVPMTQITRAMPRAVIGAEDARFCAHNGFDMGAIEAAMAKNATSKKLRGGSTISQQTAKNAFLWPQRSWLRKGLEAYFTVLIENIWPKHRIMEVYLNIAEMGAGIYGVEAAAQHYYKTSAAKLTPRQAARIAAILPSPVKRDPQKLDRRNKRHARAIEKRIRVVRDDAIDGCLNP